MTIAQRADLLAPALTRFFWRGTFARTNGPAARAHDGREHCDMGLPAANRDLRLNCRMRAVVPRAGEHNLELLG